MADDFDLYFDDNYVDGFNNDDEDLILPPLLSDDSEKIEQVIHIEDRKPENPPKTANITRKRKNISKSPKKLSSKKIVQEEEKLLKKLLKNELKSQKPKECMKFMQICVDSCLKYYLNDGKNVLKNSLAEFCPDSEIRDQESSIRNNLVCWRRKNANDPAKITQEIDFCLILRENDPILNENFLNDLRKNALPIEHRLTLVLLSVDHKFNAKKDDRLFEMCFSTKTNYHFVKNLEELAKYLASFTKSIAEKIFKLQKTQSQTFLDFAPCTSRQKMDAVHKGQSESEKKFVWRRMIHASCGSRPNAEQAAKVICEKYPTLRSLVDEYENLPDEKSRQSLLQNLIADPLTGVRVGPAISAAICLIFTSENPKELVDKKGNLEN
uniref:Crossover junction endonuclease EME1 n=1 Tax=Romanomermis culicivorax TaxID=13658 RepID=A0A915JQW2_ROMCU